MEEYGIYYYFTHDSSTHKLNFADDPNSHTQLSDKIDFKFDLTETRVVEDAIWDWSSEFSLHSGKYMVRDYNFETPNADLTAKSIKTADHQYPDFEVYEYPGPYKDTDLGQTIADVRMQAIASDRAVYNGKSNSRKLHSGWKFELDKHTDSAMNQVYLVVSTDISAGIGEGMSTTEDEGEKRDTYRVIMQAIEGTTPFRLHRRIKRPMIRGPQTAKVVGPSGEEIYTDQYGRVKVKFYWDRAETSDEDRTCWIRVSQPWGGANWGAMVIPRIGMEVVVEFLEGNPDRPLITGVVYNATQTVPYSLPANKTQSGFKTNSSPGGSGFNELRFEDKAGEEEVFFQAQKDYNKKVLNNETVEITQDTTTTVKEGNRSITVSQGNTSVTVSAGNHSLTVSVGKSEVSAATSITLTSGPSSIQISPSGITISAPQISATADASMSLDGGGEMSLTAGMISIN
jgi:type VI secretion system secreted protein VgrG